MAERAKLEAAAKTCPVKQSLHPEVKTPVEFVYRSESRPLGASTSSGFHGRKGLPMRGG